MGTVYFVGIPIATLIAAAFDPTNEQQEYKVRGLHALIAGILWPLVALGLLGYGLCGLVGQAGSRLMEYALNKWPDYVR